MNQGPFQSTRRTQLRSPVTAWIVVISLCLGFMLAVECVAKENQNSVMPSALSISDNVIIYGNLLLLASTILYLLHLYFRTQEIGIWATRLAIAGALVLVAGLVVGTTETGLADESLTSSLNVMTLFSSATVVIYLVMEKIYRTRSAGAFVMPIVAAAVLFVAFGKSTQYNLSDIQQTGLQNYWSHAQILTNIIAYGAFAIAAALAILYLWRQAISRQALEQAAEKPFQFELSKIEKVMHQAIFFGVLLLAVSTVLGIGMSLQNSGEYLHWEAKEAWSASILLLYSTYLYGGRVRKWHGRKMAYWAVIGFCLVMLSFLA
ncbi:MAG: cytochrome c biogenesis protein CcsA [Pseudomonadota bacterium]